MTDEEKGGLIAVGLVILGLAIGIFILVTRTGGGE